MNRFGIISIRLTLWVTVSMQVLIINKAAGGNATIGIRCNMLIEATRRTDQELFPKSLSTTGTTPQQTPRDSVNPPVPAIGPDHQAILFWLPGELLAGTRFLSLSI